MVPEPSFQEGFTLKRYQGDGRKVEQSRTEAQWSLSKLTRGERVISEQEPVYGRGWLVDRKKNHTEHFQGRACKRNGEKYFPKFYAYGIYFQMYVTDQIIWNYWSFLSLPAYSNTTISTSPSAVFVFIH